MAKMAPVKAWALASWFQVLCTLFAIGVIFSAVHRVEAQATPYWFQVGNGDTTCQAQTASTSPFRFDWLCKNSRGQLAGAYTPNPANTASDVMTFGLQGPGAQQGPEGVGVLCLIAVNMTGTPILVGSFGSVGASSVAWQCNGQSVGSLPVPTAAPALKGAKK
jgi:hypothetical protein